MASCPSQRAAVSAHGHRLQPSPLPLQVWQGLAGEAPEERTAEEDGHPDPRVVIDARRDVSPVELERMQPLLVHVALALEERLDISPAMVMDIEAGAGGWVTGDGHRGDGNAREWGGAGSRRHVRVRAGTGPGKVTKTGVAGGAGDAGDTALTSTRSSPNMSTRAYRMSMNALRLMISWSRPWLPFTDFGRSTFVSSVRKNSTSDVWIVPL